MLKDVTLGRYYRVESIIHSLDPRVKLFSLLIYIVSLFLFTSWTALLLTLVSLFLVVKASKVPFRYMVKGLRSIAFIVIFAALLSAMLGKGGWVKTIFTTYRMIALVFASNLLTLTTKPREISDGLEKAMGWLSVFHFPVHDTATIISLSFRFIPILSEEANRIIDAQKSRGARIGEGRLKERIKSLLPITVPLFVSAFRRADELSLAMDSRLYGSGIRKPWKSLRYRMCDYYAYGASLLLLVLTIILRYVPCL